MDSAAEGQRLIYFHDSLRCLVSTPEIILEGTMGIAKGAEKEEANLLEMAPLSALYVRHHQPFCTPSAVLPSVGSQCNFMLGAGDSSASTGISFL